ncbi:hypothetical protein NicSoilE8_03020 [Arthrobacter sp. NicSoilE8]|nr:hypothetical protein NicSoilE8_03020 [Arthrobacter sp. NicSoilE8]
MSARITEAAPVGVPAEQAPRTSRKTRIGAPVGSCAELACGDFIEARSGSSSLRGEVVAVHASMELFWVLGQDGGRRIVELCDSKVFITPRPPYEGKRAGRIGLSDHYRSSPPISREN